MLRIIILIPLPRERKPNSRKKKSRLHWLRSRLTAGYLLTGLCTTGLDGLGMTWQLHKKTRTKVRVFRAKNYLQKLFTFSTRKWPKNYLLMYDSLTFSTQKWPKMYLLMYDFPKFSINLALVLAWYLGTGKLFYYVI
jgi:hypothetical protein